MEVQQTELAASSQSKVMTYQNGTRRRENLETREVKAVAGHGHGTKPATFFLYFPSYPFLTDWQANKRGGIRASYEYTYILYLGTYQPTSDIATGKRISLFPRTKTCAADGEILE